MPAEDKLPISRRTVLASATFVPLAALTAAAQSSKATALLAPERQILDAIVDRLVPADELGPGALEMGAANYIDLSLAEYLAPEKGNFVEGLAAVDALAKTQHGAAFAALTPEQKDGVLSAMESGAPMGSVDSRAFFNRVRRLTLEGMFCDPYYGGNKNFGGWDLIRYPGPRLAVGPDDQKMSALPKAVRQSAYGSSHGH